jgi:hypothetical protein
VMGLARGGIRMRRAYESRSTYTVGYFEISVERGCDMIGPMCKESRERIFRMTLIVSLEITIRIDRTCS